jgi:DNA-binding transcriptional MocR family regulator
VNKTERIVTVIAQQIESGSLRPGARLPPIRRAAEQNGVSKNTIVEAYDRLVAMGLIAARQGAGFSVVEQQHGPRPDTPPPQHLVEAVDSISLLRAQLDKAHSLRVGDGRPPASWMEGIMPRRLIDLGADGEGNDSSGYGSPHGYGGLRELIVARHQAQNIDLSPRQIVTTFGANHALDLIIRRYLSAGDTVLVDDPGYYPLFAKLKLMQVRFVGVRRTANGPDLDDLRQKAERERPAMFFTQSTAHNPTGSSMDLPTAHGVLQIAGSHGFMVVDDDPFVDLPGVQGVRLAALDQFRNVIFTGTFSKTLSASFRSGYIAGPEPIASELAELKMITAVNSARFSELLIAQMIQSGRFHKHMARIAKRLEGEAKDVRERLASLGLKSFTAEAAGYYSYLLLPKGHSDIELAQKASQQGIFLAPGSFFAVEPENYRPGIRINIARANDPRFFRFLREQFG